MRAWRDEIDRLAGSRQPEAAAAQLELPAIRRLADRVEIDLARWAVAGAWLAVGDDLEALKLARRAAARSGDIVPEIHWTAGFSAWRLGRSDLAARHFTALAQAEAAHPSERSRAAFWAARAYIVEQKPQHVAGFLRIAAEDTQGIYGLLARAVLGEEEVYDWSYPEALDDGLACGRRAARRAAGAGARPDRAERPGRAGDPQARRTGEPGSHAGPDRAGGVARSAGGADAPRPEPAPPRRRRAIMPPSIRCRAGSRPPASPSTGRWCTP